MAALSNRLPERFQSDLQVLHTCIISNEHMSLDEIQIAQEQIQVIGEQLAQMAIHYTPDSMGTSWNIVNSDRRLLQTRLDAATSSSWTKPALVAAGVLTAGLMLYLYPYYAAGSALAIGVPYAIVKCGVSQRKEKAEPAATERKDAAVVSGIPSLYPSVSPYRPSGMAAASMARPATQCLTIAGDLFKQDVEVLVNAANSGLWAGGGICGIFADKAGPGIFRELAGRTCPPGQAVITTGGRLQARFVAHAVGPDLRDAVQFKNWRNLLASAYTSALREAHNKGARSIAFPMLSSGIFNTDVATLRPIANPAELQNVAEEAIRDYARRNPDHFARILLIKR